MAAPRPTPLRRGRRRSTRRCRRTRFQWPLRGPHLCDGLTDPSDARDTDVSMAAPRPTPLRRPAANSTTGAGYGFNGRSAAHTLRRRRSPTTSVPTRRHVSMAAPRPTPLRRRSHRGPDHRPEQFQWPLRGPHLCDDGGRRLGTTARRVSMAAPRPTPLRRCTRADAADSPASDVSMAAPRPTPLRRGRARTCWCSVRRFQWPLRGPHLCDGGRPSGRVDARMRFNGRSAAHTSATDVIRRGADLRATTFQWPLRGPTSAT